MNWIELEFQGRTVRVPAMRAQGKLWFHWQGENHVVDVAGGARRAGEGKGKAHPGVIAAPMPGKVTKVAIAKHDKVKKGQPLVVMEAMKMEYTLEADRDGFVQEIGAGVGQQVALGTVLVRIGDE